MTDNNNNKKLHKKKSNRTSRTHTQNFPFFVVLAFFFLLCRLYLCTFTLSVSLAALLLLPASILANEVLLHYPYNYYLQWLNASLIRSKFLARFLFEICPDLNQAVHITSQSRVKLVRGIHRRTILGSLTSFSFSKQIVKDLSNLNQLCGSWMHRIHMNWDFFRRKWGCGQHRFDWNVVFSVSFWAVKHKQAYVKVTTTYVCFVPIDVVLSLSFCPGLWNDVFICSNMCLLLLMPFVYFFTEAEGFSGFKHVREKCFPKKSFEEKNVRFNLCDKDSFLLMHFGNGMNHQTPTDLAKATSFTRPTTRSSDKPYRETGSRTDSVKLALHVRARTCVRDLRLTWSSSHMIFFTICGTAT